MRAAGKVRNLPPASKAPSGSGKRAEFGQESRRQPSAAQVPFISLEGSDPHSTQRLAPPAAQPLRSSQTL